MKSRNNLWPDNDFYLQYVVYLRNSPFWWRLEVQITMQKPQKHPKPLSDHPVWSFTVVRILVKVTSALSIIHFLYVVLMENSSNNVWLLKWLLFVWKALELTQGILCDILNDCSKTLNLNHRDRVNYFQTKEFSNLTLIFISAICIRAKLSVTWKPFHSNKNWDGFWVTPDRNRDRGTKIMRKNCREIVWKCFE